MFEDLDGNTVVLHTRSVFGAYRFLGEMLLIRGSLDHIGRGNTMTGMFTGNPPTEFLYLTHDETNCWVSVTYENDRWCVPGDAFKTKRIFALLHQMFELYARPNNQPNTSTVRVTPG